MVVLILRARIRGLAAGVGRRRQPFHDGKRRGTETRWIDAVANERRTEVKLAAAVARWRGERREIAGNHLRRRNELDVVRRKLTPESALIRAEEEQLVVHDWTTKRSSELIALQTIVLALAVGTDRRKRARRVETVIA